MPKVGTNSPAPQPRWLPISLLRPGQQFKCPPGCSTSGGKFIGMIGDDAKVVLQPHEGREYTTYWTGAAMVWPGDKIEVLIQAPPKQQQQRAARSDERHTSVLTRKEVKAVVEKVNARPVAAPVVRRAMIGRKA